jgi:hypothetical protein
LQTIFHSIFPFSPWKPSSFCSASDSNDPKNHQLCYSIFQGILHLELGNHKNVFKHRN